MTIEQPASRRGVRSVAAVWILMVIGAVLLGIFVRPSHVVALLPVVLGGGILVTFCLQLALDRKDGLVNRVIASLGGSVVILAIATAVFAIIAAVRS